MLPESVEPVPNSAFEILRCGGRTGVFGDFSYPTNAVGLALEYSISNVVVRVVNTRPKLDPIPDQELAAGDSLQLTVHATDADVPAQDLVYSLTNAPAGAILDAAGVLRWAPSAAEAGSLTQLTVVVSDSGSPPLLDSRTFSVRVGPGSELRAVSVEAGVPVAGACTLSFRGLPGVAYRAEYSPVITGPWLEFATATAGADGIWTVVDLRATNVARFYRAR
jgi:hypothetical protein